MVLVLKLGRLDFLEFLSECRHDCYECNQDLTIEATRAVVYKMMSKML